MSSYRVKLAHNQALGTLTVLNPQPQSRGVQATVEDYFASGATTERGLYVELFWGHFESALQYQNVISSFSLTLNKSANVTIYCRDQLYNWHLYNGVAIRPQANWDNFFPRDVTILVRNLVRID